MRFSNDNITRSDRETYTTSKARTLSAGDEIKTVYAEFDTNGDDIAEDTANDDIYLEVINCMKQVRRAKTSNNLCIFPVANL